MHVCHPKPTGMDSDDFFAVEMFLIGLVVALVISVFSYFAYVLCQVHCNDCHPFRKHYQLSVEDPINTDT